MLITPSFKKSLIVEQFQGNYLNGIEFNTAEMQRMNQAFLANLGMIFNEGGLPYNYYLTNNFSLDSKDDFLSGRRILSFEGIPFKGQSPLHKIDIRGF